MHPVFYLARNFFAVCMVWVVIGLLAVYFLTGQLHIAYSTGLVLLVPPLFFYLFFCLANYHVSIRLKARRASIWRAVITHGLAALVSVMIWLGLSLVYARLLPSDDHDYPALFGMLFESLAALGLMLYGFWVLLHHIYLMAREQEASSRGILQEQLLLTQTELQTLRATVHPHFVFNSLNAIGELAHSEPHKVRDLCLQVSQFLRYSLRYSKKELVPVKDEVHHIEHYLSIERERFGGRLQVVLQVDPKAYEIPIPSLLLFPLVENSIKHGIAACVEGGLVKVNIVCDTKVLLIDIQNPYDPLSKPAGGERIGLQTVRKRLRMHYGDRARLQVEHQADRFVVTLSLPLTVQAITDRT